MTKRQMVREQLVWDGIKPHLVDQYMRMVEETFGGSGEVWSHIGLREVSWPYSSIQDVVDDCRLWLDGCR